METKQKKRIIIAASACALTAGIYAMLQHQNQTGSTPNETGIAISVFEPHAGGCAWTKVDPFSHVDISLGAFHNDCDGIHVAWDQGITKALVWFSTDQDGSIAYLSHMNSTQPEDLPLSQAGITGDVISMAFSEDQAPLAFTNSLDLPVAHDAQGDYIAFENQRYPLLQDHEGVDALVHTFKREGSKWTRIETMASRCCTDMAPGISTLKEFQKTTGTASGEMRNSQEILSPPDTLAPIIDSVLLTALSSKIPELDPKKQNHPQGYWTLIQSEEPSTRDLVIWVSQSSATDDLDLDEAEGEGEGENEISPTPSNTPSSSTPVIRSNSPNGIDTDIGHSNANVGEDNEVNGDENGDNKAEDVAPPVPVSNPSGHAFWIDRATHNVSQIADFPFSIKNQIAWQLSGSYILIVEAFSGMQPRLYDLASGQLLWKSDVAEGVVLWPRQ